MAVISNRTTLNDAVTGYLGRSDLTSFYDLWVQQAEKYIQRKLRTGESRASITINSADANALPALTKQVRTIRVQSPVGHAPIELVSATVLEEMRARYAGATGVPQYGHINTETLTLSVAPTPGASYTADVVYVAGLSPLGAVGTDTSPALTAHPDLYLYATLREACEFLEDPRVDKMGARVDEILHWIRVEKDETEAGGAPQMARLPVQF